MKFPKISSVDLTSLPTDSSELTAQEKYIFDTVFEPEVKMFSQDYSKNFSQPPMMQQTIKEHFGYKTHHSLVKRITISLALTLIILLYSISPLPSMMSLKFNSVFTYVMFLAVFLLCFLVLSKFIK